MPFLVEKYTYFKVFLNLLKKMYRIVVCRKTIYDMWNYLTIVRVANPRILVWCVACDFYYTCFFFRQVRHVFGDSWWIVLLKLNLHPPYYALILNFKFHQMPRIFQENHLRHFFKLYQWLVDCHVRHIFWVHQFLSKNFDIFNLISGVIQWRQKTFPIPAI